MNKLMDLKEVADRAGVHYRTVYCAVKSGKLKSCRFGRLWRVSEEALTEYLNGEGKVV